MKRLRERLARFLYRTAQRVAPRHIGAIVFVRSDHGLIWAEAYSDIGATSGDVDIAVRNRGMHGVSVMWAIGEYAGVSGIHVGEPGPGTCVVTVEATKETG